MNRFEDLETFVCVAEMASVRRAADHLHRAPSAVSRRIKELEARLKVQLLNRTTRQITLTSAGERFLARAKSILQDLQEAEEGATLDSDTVSGQLRVTMPLSFGLAYLAPAISEFMTQHPSVAIDADFSDRAVDIIGSRIDLAIRIGKLSDSSLRSRRLAPIHYAVAASSEFWREWGIPKTPAQLAVMPALCYSNLASPTVWPWANAHGKSGQVVVTPRYLASNGDALVNAAISGQGVVRLPTFLLDYPITEGVLQPVLMSHNWGVADLYALYPNTAFLPNRTRVFIDFLISRIGDQPEWDSCLRAHLEAINQSPQLPSVHV